MTPSPRLVFVHENGERLGDQAKVLDKSMIIIPKPKKARNLGTLIGAKIFCKASSINSTTIMFRSWLICIHFMFGKISFMLGGLNEELSISIH